MIDENTFLRRVLVVGAAASMVTSPLKHADALGVAEYTAAEAPRHIGEKATVVGTVECIDAGRTFHCLTLDGCLSNSPFWIIVNDNASGPNLNVQDLTGVSVAVTGQIEKRDASSHPWMIVKSTAQIHTRTPLNTDHISRGHEEASKGDLDGAIVEFTQAIEHQPDRRAEAYEFRGWAKERKGDWNGALANYDALVALDPNKAAPYYIRATAKKQHGDFEGAVADFSRAAELRASGISFIEIGNMRKANGDSPGATAEYDKAIAMLDNQIAGTRKASDSPDLLWYHRGYAKELKGDVDGAVSDYSQAIAIKPSYQACAYSRRGDIKKARGDLAGAISDYAYAVRYAQLPEDKEKLRRAQAEANQQPEQARNKSEVTPDSIAEAFVQAYSGANVDTLANLYGDHVDYANNGVIGRADIRKQAREYFERWPVRHWSLTGQVTTTPMGPSRQKVIFSATYETRNPQTNKHTSGVATETLIVASDIRGAIKIVSQTEQTGKKAGSQPDEQISKDQDVVVPEAKDGQQTDFALKCILHGYSLQSGYAESNSRDGVEILKGNIHGSVQGVPWAAAVNAQSKVMWAARPQEPPFTAAALTTDGQYLWSAAVLTGSGIFHLGKFNAGNLRKEAAVQTTFPPTESTIPTFRLHFEREGDLRVSLQQVLPNSIRLAVFSSDLRLVLDKSYSLALALAGKQFNGPASMKLLPLPDGSGYYMVIESPVVRGKRDPRVNLVRLDKNGGVVWANTYAIGSYDNNLQPRVAQDGAILLAAATYKDSAPEQSILIKINPDGKVAWGTAVKGLDASWEDFDSVSSFESTSYLFTQPSLLVVATERTALDEPWWLRKSYSVLLVVNYQTGTIEKQVKLEANHPGEAWLAARDTKSFYLSFWNETQFEKPSGHGHQVPQKPPQFQAAVLRVDYDLNLLSALKLHTVALDRPFLHLLGSDKVVISYPYDDQKGTTTITVESASANLESPNRCHWLEKENFSLIKSNFQQQPAGVDVSPLGSITVSDANTKLSDADVTVAPLDLKGLPCQAKK